MPAQGRGAQYIRKWSECIPMEESKGKEVSVSVSSELFLGVKWLLPQ